MTDLITIPVVVSSLMTFFTMGGSEAAMDLIKGITVNGAVKLSELIQDLTAQAEVSQAVQAYQQSPMDIQLKSELEAVLEKALEQHPSFKQQTAVQVQGDIKAEQGSVAAAVISGGKINIKNTFK